MGYPLNSTVEEVGRLNISGNIINPNWLRHLITPTGNPSPIAALILSDIVFWYRPTEVRDEATGQFLRFERKFKADLLQRSYDAISKQWGITKRQAKDACKVLESCGIVKLELRTITTEDGRKISNVMFIRLFPDRLAEITFNLNLSSYDIPDEGYDEISSQVYRENGIAGTKNRKTNTKTTTEISPQSFLYSSAPDLTDTTVQGEENKAAPVRAMDGKAYCTVEKKERTQVKIQVQKLLGLNVLSKNICSMIDQLPLEEVEDAIQAIELKIQDGLAQPKWAGYFVGILKRKIDPNLNKKPLTVKQIKKMHTKRQKMDSCDLEESCPPIRIKKGGEWIEAAFSGYYQDDFGDGYEAINYYLYREFEGKRYVNSHSYQSDRLDDVEVYPA